MNKARADAFIREIETTGSFPNNLEGVKNLLNYRHLQNKEEYIKDLFNVSLKKILFCDFEENSISDTDKLSERYILSFVSIYHRLNEINTRFENDKITKIIEKTKENRFYTFYILLGEYKLKFIWDYASDAVKEKFKAYLEENSSNHINEISQIDVIALSVFLGLITEKEIAEKYQEISARDKLDFRQRLEHFEILNKNQSLNKKLIRMNLDTFTNSRSFPDARENAMYLIKPIINDLSKEDVIYLLDKAIESQKQNYSRWHNNQLNVCEPTFINIFDSTIEQYPETLSDWKCLIEQTQLSGWQTLKQKIESLSEPVF
jgi:hypothetical protein